MSLKETIFYHESATVFSGGLHKHFASSNELTQAELSKLAGKIGGQNLYTIAIRYLGYNDEGLQDLAEGLRSNVDGIKFKVLLGWYQRNPEGNPRYVSTDTPCSKRKYTLCFPVSTQNVARAGPPAVLRDSQSEFLNNQATVGEEIPNGSKVLRESLLGSCLRKFTKMCFCH